MTKLPSLPAKILKLIFEKSLYDVSELYVYEAVKCSARQLYALSNVCKQFREIVAYHPAFSDFHKRWVILCKFRQNVFEINESVSEHTLVLWRAMDEHEVSQTISVNCLVTGNDFMTMTQDLLTLESTYPSQKLYVIQYHLSEIKWAGFDTQKIIECLANFRKIMKRISFFGELADVSLECCTNCQSETYRKWELPKYIICKQSYPICDDCIQVVFHEHVFDYLCRDCYKEEICKRCLKSHDECSYENCLHGNSRGIIQCQENL